jgi:hypothetical protein
MNAKTLCISAVLFLAGASLFAADKADPRVAKQLDKIGIEYSTTKSNNYSIAQDLDGGRKQTVYIMSKTQTIGGLEVREIWSNAGSFTAEPTSDQMLTLLSDNNAQDMGAWTIEASDDGSYLAYFSIKVPTYIRDKDLSDVIDLAATAADAMELKLFNADEN